MKVPVEGVLLLHQINPGKRLSWPVTFLPHFSWDKNQLLSLLSSESRAWLMALHVSTIKDCVYGGVVPNVWGERWELQKMKYGFMWSGSTGKWNSQEENEGMVKGKKNQELLQKKFCCFPKHIYSVPPLFLCLSGSHKHTFTPVRSLPHCFLHN